MKVRYESLMARGEVDAANEFRLHDPNDKSEYISAQLLATTQSVFVVLVHFAL